jgi:hypothetical protein
MINQEAATKFHGERVILRPCSLALLWAARYLLVLHDAMKLA